MVCLCTLKCYRFYLGLVWSTFAEDLKVESTLTIYKHQKIYQFNKYMISKLLLSYKNFNKFI